MTNSVILGSVNFMWSVIGLKAVNISEIQSHNSIHGGIKYRQGEQDRQLSSSSERPTSATAVPDIRNLPSFKNSLSFNETINLRDLLMYLWLAGVCLEQLAYLEFRNPEPAVPPN